MGKLKQMSFFDRYLSIWVAICIIVGIAIGKLLPGVPAVLEKLEYAMFPSPLPS
jgi:ACR3 family arsenite transporter